MDLASEIIPNEGIRLATQATELGIKLYIQFKHSVSIHSLDLVIRNIEEPVDLLPNDHSRVAAALSNLGAL